MYMITLKPGKIYYIVYEFNPHIGPSIEKAKCIKKMYSECLEKDKIIIVGNGTFEVDEDSPYHNTYRFSMDYIKDYVFTDFYDACNKLNEIKQNRN